MFVLRGIIFNLCDIFLFHVIQSFLSRIFWFLSHASIALNVQSFCVQPTVSFVLVKLFAVAGEFVADCDVRATSVTYLVYVIALTTPIVFKRHGCVFNPGKVFFGSLLTVKKKFEYFFVRATKLYFPRPRGPRVTADEPRADCCPLFAFPS